MWIQNRIKITISVMLIMTCIFSLTSCVFRTPLGRFEKEKPEYDYLVIEFSETSYAWVDCNNVDWYGEWTFNQKTIPILFYIRANESALDMYSLEGVCGVGEIYHFDDPEQTIKNYILKSVPLFDFHFGEVDKQNKIVTCRIETVYKELQDGMILSEDQEIFVKKATSEEWQQWMKEHSLDPNLYMQ